jgi:hypothetical protein
MCLLSREYPGVLDERLRVLRRKALIGRIQGRHATILQCVKLHARALARNRLPRRVSNLHHMSDQNNLSKRRTHQMRIML